MKKNLIIKSSNKIFNMPSPLSPTISRSVHSPNILLEDTRSPEFESQFIEKIKNKLKSNDSYTSWGVIDDSIFFPRFMLHKDGSASGIAKSTGIIQAPPEEIVGWIKNISEETLQNHMKQSGLDLHKYPKKEVSFINDHHHLIYMCRKLPFPLAARDFLTRGISQQNDEDDSLTLVYGNVHDDHPDVPQNFKPSTLQGVIRGDYSSYYKLVRLPNDQSFVTMIAGVDVKGESHSVSARQ